MTAITPNTFDALRQYVGVRLQQGVPLVDADWNEQEDVRRFELRAFLKWFVGDGVPEGRDGFRVRGGLADPNDVTISAGLTAGPVDGLQNVGRCLVDGLDVIIQADVRFRQQLLHVSGGAAADTEAARLGLPGPPLRKIDELPNVTGPVIVYLDVWERLVTPSEDTSLVLPGLGVESCARLKREWVVRARAGTEVPTSGQPDFIAGHSYYALARVARRGAGVVTVADVTDLRERRLLVPPSTLIEDTLGVAQADYRRGAGRPAISLRTAINALLSGRLPTTPDTALAPATGVDTIRRAFAFDRAGGLLAIWTSSRGGPRQVYGSWLALDDVAAGFGGATLLTPPVSGTPHEEADAVVLPNGDVLLTYTAGSGTARDVKFKRGAGSALAGAAEQDVAATGGVVERTPSVVVAGTRAVFFYATMTPTRWFFRRFDHQANAWIDGTGQNVPAVVVDGSSDFDLHAAVDASDMVWTAFATSTGDIRALQINPATGARSNETTLDSGAGDDARPFVLPTPGAVHVFWSSSTGLHSARFEGTSWTPAATLSVGGSAAMQPAAARAPDGGIWLFWAEPVGTAGFNDVFCARVDEFGSGFQQLTTSPSDDSAPHSLIDPSGVAWTFWASDRSAGGTDVDLFWKRLFTAV